jgi:hypothetical protein
MATRLVTARVAWLLSGASFLRAGWCRSRWRGPRRREITRAREVVCDFLVGDNDYASTGESLDAYFFAFAVAARRDR